MTKKVYLDYNATGPVLPEVLEAMLPYFTVEYGNPSSVHSLGQDAMEAVEDARDKVAELIGAEPNEVIFTSGGSESDNFAIKGFIQSLKGKKSHVITSAVEHKAVLESTRFLEDNGVDITYLGVDKSGRLDIDELKRAIIGDTRLITIMYANNETGTLFDIPSIGEIARDRGIAFHTDAVQAVGKIPVDVKRDKIDMLSIAGHKMGAPKGVGAIYVNGGLNPRPTPIIHGGHHEFNMRAGTVNVPSVVGLGASAEIAKNGLKKKGEMLKRLRDRLEAGILERIDNVQINGDLDNRLSNTSNMSFAYVEGESIMIDLDLHGICVSSGSACASDDISLSHVLEAMGVDPVIGQGTIRFSLGGGNTEEEIDYVIETIPKIVKRLRDLSPLSRAK
ncbi:MAG: cysteine desulfurase NifS [Deltaproteobacteria bacterium]|uniref:Cysteine desulfurase n=1 Tax=Candidatus Zymogenus saltonus TaxID=2844893 RepID=A0A9D8KGN2_9DELT|nr:cysteine desulfurase NifS [Candidatus Zymogenus saltonus]